MLELLIGFCCIVFTLIRIVHVFRYFISMPLNRIEITTVLMQGYWKYSHNMINLVGGRKRAYGLYGTRIL